MAFQSKKQYGLLMPKKKEMGIKKANVFGEDSDEEDGHDAVNMDIKKMALQAKVKRKTQLQIDQALEVDPTVYDYDSIYDSMKAEKEEKNAAVKQKADKKPRYIQGLMKAAENRKREDERRQERKVQKERENEGGEFADKDVFITGAYRKKMQEMQELEEKEKREAEMEALLDVKKQNDMTGFYRYLLRETTDDPQAVEPESSGQPDANDSVIKQEKEEGTNTVHVKDEKPEAYDYRELDADSSSESLSSDEPERRKHSKSPERNRSNRHRSRSKERYRSKRERSRSKDTKDYHYDKRHKKTHRSHSKERERHKDKERSRHRSRSPERQRKRERSKSQERKRKSEKNEDGKSVKKEHEIKKANIENREKHLSKREESEEEVVLPQPPLPGKSTPSDKQDKYAKKTTESEAEAARRRYLERKLAKEKAK